MPKHKSPQFDLPHAEEVFNLQSEPTLDGARLQEDKRIRELAAAQSEARQPVLALRFAPRSHTPRCNDLSPLTAKEAHARRALRELEGFIGGRQRRTVLECFRGEEREWFFDKIISLHQLIATMPKTYEQDGKGDQAIAYLHYFAGSQANAWVTEKDKCAEQRQAFGLVDMFSDGGELGYLSLVEWTSNNAELDFHFTPCTLAEVRQKRGV